MILTHSVLVLTYSLFPSLFLYRYLFLFALFVFSLSVSILYSLVYFSSQPEQGKPRFPQKTDGQLEVKYTVSEWVSEWEEGREKKEKSFIAELVANLTDFTCYKVSNDQDCDWLNTVSQRLIRAHCPHVGKSSVFAFSWFWRRNSNFKHLRSKL